MKLRFTTSLTAMTLTFLATIANPLSAQEVPGIPEITTPPVIDGVIDSIWHAQPAFPIAQPNNGIVENEADFSAEWYGLWDDTYLYFLIDITDQFLEDSAGAANWQNDIIEVYFNMDNVKSGTAHEGDNYQYGFHWNKPDEENVVPNGSWEGIEWGMVTNDTGYIVEVKIPWTTLTTLTIEEGFSFGFDIAVNDNDGFSSYDSVRYWWKPTPGGLWNNIADAGTLLLDAPFDGNYPPMLQQLDTQVAFEGTSSAIDIIATDLNPSDNLTITSDDLPAFASLVDNGDGTAAVTVNAAAGDAEIYTFSIIASDGSKTDETEVTLIVKDPNVPTQAPVFTSVPDLNVYQFNQRIVTIEVMDIDSLEVDIYASDIPSFGSLTDNGDKTATLVFLPTADHSIEDYTAHIQAMDPDGNIADLEFTVSLLPEDERTVYYCDPDAGHIENPGSPEAPFGSLEDLMNSGMLFAEGDVILLRSGYHGNVVLSAANAGTVTIMPDTGAEPILSQVVFSGASEYWTIQGVQVSRSFREAYPGGSMVQVSGSHNVVSGITVFSYPDTSSWSLNDWLTLPVYGVHLGGSNNVLENSIIKDIRLGVQAGGENNIVRGNHIQNFTIDGIRAPGNYLLIEDNYIADNYNIDDNHDDGIQSYTFGDPVTAVTIRRNFIIQTTDPDRPFQGPLQGIGCFDGMFEDWVVESNIVVVNQYHGIAFYGAINCRIINNTVIDMNPHASPSTTWITILPHKNHGLSGNTPEQNEYFYGGGNIVRNNLASTIDVHATFGVVANNRTISSGSYDSYFVDFPYDLRLKAGSPAIDAASNTDAAATDFDGNLRPIDGDGDGNAIADLGAHEYSGAWRGIPSSGDFVETDTGFGWLYIARDPWIWSYGTSSWIYLSEAWQPLDGGWIFFPR